MRLFDKDKEREMLEDMPSVLENEYIRIEVKDGRRIKSANVSMRLDGLDHGVAVGVGDFEGMLSRTVECIVSLGASVMAHVNDTDLAEESMKVAMSAALDLFKNSTANKETVDETTMKLEVSLGGE